MEAGLPYLRAAPAAGEHAEQSQEDAEDRPPDRSGQG